MPRSVVTLSIIGSVFLFFISFHVCNGGLFGNQADSPTPYLAVNLCPSTTANQFVVSSTACNGPVPGSGSAQTIPLTPVLLVNGVSYVPAIVRSSSVGACGANAV